MTTAYDPYLPDVEDLHRESIEHLSQAFAVLATGETVDLGAVDGDITFDSSNAPHVQAELTAAVPESQAILSALDPRLGARVRVSLGYKRPDFTEDIHLAADLGLRHVPTNRPNNTIGLSAAGDEMLAQDVKRFPSIAAPPLTGLNELVLNLATLSAYPSNPTLKTAFPTGYQSDALQGLEWQIGDDAWSVINEAQARTGAWVYCNGNREWIIGRRAEVAGLSVLKLTVGEGGTILTSTATRSRDSFANGVCLVYEWTDANGAQKTVYGTAQASNGPYAVATIGRVFYTESRKGPITQALASSNAAYVLTNLLTRGREMELTAVAAYWVRPGMTMTVQLPTGDQERMIIRRVVFKLGTGGMELSLRQPNNAEISTNG